MTLYFFHYCIGPVTFILAASINCLFNLDFIYLFIFFMIFSVVGWMVVLKKICLRPSILEPVKMPLFGNCVIAEVIHLKILRWDHSGLSRWLGNSMTNVLVRYRRGKDTNTEEKTLQRGRWGLGKIFSFTLSCSSLDNCDTCPLAYFNLIQLWSNFFCPLSMSSRDLFILNLNL